MIGSNKTGKQLDELRGKDLKTIHQPVPIWKSEIFRYLNWKVSCIPAAQTTGSVSVSRRMIHSTNTSQYLLHGLICK